MPDSPDMSGRVLNDHAPWTLGVEKLGNFEFKLNSFLQSATWFYRLNS